MTQLATTREETAVTRRVVNDDSEFSMMLDTGKFEHLQRLAKLFCSSTLIPEHFRGEENLGNCFIAIQMAVRLRVDPLMFMQKSYIVQGKPGMEAQLAIALVNSSGLFKDPIEYQVQCDVADDPFDPSYMVRAYAVRTSTGKRIDGPWIDWKMVKAEGWFDKKGSKWQTMPAVMFMYRAATFFARTACPERLMGMSTVDELDDIARSPQMQAGVNSRLAALMPAVEGAIIQDAVHVDAALNSHHTTPKTEFKPAAPEPAAPQAPAQNTTPVTVGAGGGTTTNAPSPQSKRPRRQQTPEEAQAARDSLDAIGKDSPAAPVATQTHPNQPETSIHAPGEPSPEQQRADLAEEFATNTPINDLRKYLLGTQPKALAAAFKVAALPVTSPSQLTDQELRDVAYNVRIAVAK